MRPLREVRARFGDRIELMVDGHGFFLLPAALRIADALRELRPLWLEDILKMDNLETLADFRRQSRMPISASEMLLCRPDFARVLESRAADFIMIDPTWAGGISESVRLRIWPWPTTCPRRCTTAPVPSPSLRGSMSMRWCQAAVSRKPSGAHPHFLRRPDRHQGRHSRGTCRVARRPGSGDTTQ